MLPKLPSKILENKDYGIILEEICWACSFLVVKLLIQLSAHTHCDEHLRFHISPINII